jgi:RES domain
VAWVPWQYGPFEGRWDDANGQFRVLYAGRSKLACYLEVTAQFRPDLQLLADMAAIAGDPRDDDYPETVTGAIPREWIASLLYATTIGRTEPDGVLFESRHGAGLQLYAIFERVADGDSATSPLLRNPATAALDAQDPDLLQAAEIHRLTFC